MIKSQITKKVDWTFSNWCNSSCWTLSGVKTNAFHIQKSNKLLTKPRSKSIGKQQQFCGPKLNDKQKYQFKLMISNFIFLI